MDIEKINDTELAIKEYQSERVVTFKDIDTVHGRPEGTAKRNFNANKQHFINGEDYFTVCADKIRTRKIMELSNKAREDVTFFTEQGYLMLVKSFTDDLAWDVQRKLVKSYFRKEHNVKQLTINSREVAKIAGKMHSWVLQGIRERIADLQEIGFDTRELYTETSYTTKANCTAPQFLCTERGCEDFSRCLEPYARKVFLSEFADRFERMWNVLDGKPLKKADKAIHESVPGQEPEIKIFQSSSKDFLLMDSEIYSLKPCGAETVQSFIAELQENDVEKIRIVLRAFIKSFGESSKLKEVASWGVKQEEPQSALLPDKAAQKPQKAKQRLQTDSSINLNCVENLTELQAKMRYNIGRSKLIEISDYIGAVVRVGAKRLYVRKVLDDYFKRAAE